MNRFLRIEFFSAAAGLLLLFFAAELHVPYCVKIAEQAKSLNGFWSLEKQNSEVKITKAGVLKVNRLLDSLVAANEQSTKGDEGSVASLLYERADAAGMRGCRVVMGERAKVGDRDETGVTVSGKGKYTALGKFCEAIENLPMPVRVRHITASKAEAGAIGVVIDFALLSQHSDKGK